MEEKDEPNARGRSLRGKIKSEDKYKGVSPGKLNMKVSYEFNCLYVNLGAAQLSGKASQDPYALVYLLSNETGLGLFQIGNNKTRTFKNSLNPEFNSEFQFMINSSEILQKRLSLVVAIWDRDSDSRDDYMAGIRVSLQEFVFGSSAEWKWVQLQHQSSDGHPSVISVSEIMSGQTPHKSSGLVANQGTPSKEPRQPTPYPSPQQGSPYPPAQQGTPNTATRQATPYPSPQQGSDFTPKVAPYPGGQMQSPYPGAPKDASYPGVQQVAPYPGSPYPGGQAQSPYPGGPQGTLYPSPKQSSSAYPSSSPYPPTQQGSGYPPAQQGAGYPPAQQGSGYPPAQQGSGYPPAK